jgi:hypothetical protein
MSLPKNVTLLSQAWGNRRQCAAGENASVGPGIHKISGFGRTDRVQKKKPLAFDARFSSPKMRREESGNRQ